MIMDLYIQNISRSDCSNGHHNIKAKDAWLIQISDVGQSHPKPLFEFQKVIQLNFMDIPDRDEGGIRYLDACQPEQAKQMVQFLQEAKEAEKNIVVHCVAGICRSGAVVAVGEMLGFIPLWNNINPNYRVKYLMMKELGFTYD